MSSQQQQIQQTPLSAKLVLLGDVSTGKSSLSLRFVKGQFHEFQESTIGAAFLTKTLPEQNVRFEIWDTAGQERYATLAPMYYRGAAAAIVVYDITNHKSFERAQTWIEELRKNGSPNMIVALAGNKIDLSTDRSVGQDQGRQCAQQNGLMYKETSAKDNINVEELFKEIAEKIPRQQSHQQAQPSGIQLHQEAPSQRKMGSNCC